MDELELLKNHWKKINIAYPNVSHKEIYKMIHAKSSGLVKWIFIISLMEFVFWFLVAFLFKSFGFEKDMAILQKDQLFLITSIVGYAILLYFFYRFYKNYKNISATDSIKNLMTNILKTRQTVKMYVFVNILFLILSTYYFVFYFANNDDSTKALLENAAANGELFKFYAGIAISTFIVLAVVIGLLLLFYWLIYGILLKRLHHNYKELQKLEI